MLWVEVYDNPGHMLTDRQPVQRDGTFTVNAEGSKIYELRVVTRHGDRITSDHVQFRPGQPVEIRMPKSYGEGPRPAGPISALRLSHKPVKAAKRLVQEAESLAVSGQIPASAERLTKALEADPNWFEAWNNLGTRRMQMGEYGPAAEAFRHALAIDANNSTVQSNLGLALLFLREPAGAEAAARRALQLEPDSVRATYVAGLAMLQQNKQPAEALANLRTASKLLPRALLTTAEWSCRHNDMEGCATDLRAFLKTPRGPNHEKAERWLSEVKQKMKDTER